VENIEVYLFIILDFKSLLQEVRCAISFFVGKHSFRIQSNLNFQQESHFFRFISAEGEQDLILPVQK
jgi:hypothetical protein